LAEKDITERTLESYNDVFADIVNVLLFNGEQIVKEDDLEQVTTNSCYKIGDNIKEQERDEEKLWKNNLIRISAFGFENQTIVEKKMPLRIMGYDGASYRDQLSNENKKILNGNYPFVTLVLYFGMDHWSSSRSLVDCLNIPEKLRPFVSDYKINVFEIAYLSDEQLAMFKSDFKLVADYFVQLKRTGEYKPMTDEITHVWEMLNLMSVLTNDNRFEKSYRKFKQNGKEPMTMCKVIDDYIEKGKIQGMEEGIIKGKIQGREEGREEGKIQGMEEGIIKGKESGILSSIKSIMNTLNLSAEKAIEAVGISKDEQSKYMELLKA
jgi:hypothetical protein